MQWDLEEARKERRGREGEEMRWAAKEEKKEGSREAILIMLINSFFFSFPKYYFCSFV